MPRNAGCSPSSCSKWPISCKSAAAMRAGGALSCSARTAVCNACLHCETRSPPYCRVPLVRSNSISWSTIRSMRLFLFFVDGTLVPMTQQQARQEVEHQIDQDAGQRKQEEAGEEPGDEKAIARFENAGGKPGFGAAG